MKGFVKFIQERFQTSEEWRNGLSLSQRAGDSLNIDSKRKSVVPTIGVEFVKNALKVLKTYLNRLGSRVRRTCNPRKHIVGNVNAKPTQKGASLGIGDRSKSEKNSNGKGGVRARSETAIDETLRVRTNDRDED